MAVLLTQNLINLPVRTESGEEVGRITDFEIDADSQKIFAYYVKPGRFFSGLFSGNLIIKPAQVIAISQEQMTVEDNAVKEKNTAPAGQLA